IYVAGGYGGVGGVPTHYRYDIAADIWTSVAPLPAGIFLPAASSIGGRNYVVGGGNPSRPEQPALAGDGANESPDASFTTTYVYDVAADSWSAGPSTNGPHGYTGGTAVGNTLVVV